MAATILVPSWQLPHIRRIGAVLLALLLFGLIGFGGLLVRGDDADARLVAGLSQRQLHDLAQLHINQRLANKKLTTKEAIDLSILLVKVLTDQAQSQPSATQKQAFELAYQTADERLKVLADSPRAQLLKFQREQIGLSMGELTRLSAQLSEPIDEDFRTRLRESISNLGKLDRSLTDALPRQYQKESASPRRPPPEDLSAEELLTLQMHVRQQLGRAYACQAGLYPSGSADWRNSLLKGSEFVDAALTQLPTRDQRRVRLVVLRESLRRELGEAPVSLEDLIPTLGTDPASLPPDLRSLWASELIRRHLTPEALTKASQFATEEETRLAAFPASSLSIEWDFARLELALAQWKSSPPDAANLARNRVNQLLAYIEQERGPYWSKRARQLLASDLSSSTAAEDPSALLALAEEALRKQDLPAARKFLEDASHSAQTAGQLDKAVDYAMRAAQLLQNSKDFSRAADAFLSIATRFPKSEEASQAHLAAIWNLGQLSSQNGEDNSRSLAQYAKLLSEHPDKFPSAPTLPQAFAWQGRLAESQQQWREAVIAYQSVDRNSPQFETVAPRLLIAAQQWLQSQAENPNQQKRIARALGDYYEGVLLPPSSSKESSESAAIAWNPPQQQIVLALADLWIRFLPEKLPEAEPMLRSALSANNNADPAWQSKAQALLIRAFLAQPGKEQEAQKELATLANTSPEQLPPLIEVLASTMNEVTGQRQARLGSLLLSQLNLLEKQVGATSPKQLPPKWQQYRAQALLASGKQSAAKQLLADLAKANPRDPQIQVLFAKALAGGPAEDQTASLAQWRIVASRAKPHSTTWYEAKYEVARLQIAQGKHGDAAQLVAYLLETPPGITDPSWKQRFQTLLTIASKKQ